MDEASAEVKEIKQQFEDYKIAEQNARIALKQVEMELTEDIIFAEKIRNQHPHNLPKEIVGEARGTVLLPGESLNEDGAQDSDLNSDGDSSNG
jgi:hypothetical protein